MRALPLFVVLAVLSSQSLGHARLSSSVPADGEVLAAEANAITLQFTEAIQPRFSDFALHYLGTRPDGEPDRDNRLPRETAVADAARQVIEVAVPEGARPGWYLLDWEVLAEDGHTTSGTVRFQIEP